MKRCTVYYVYSKEREIEVNYKKILDRVQEFEKISGYGDEEFKIIDDILIGYIDEERFFSVDLISGAMEFDVDNFMNNYYYREIEILLKLVYDIKEYVQVGSHYFESLE